jgi:hypothetical protein
VLVVEDEPTLSARVVHVFNVARNGPV